MKPLTKSKIPKVIVTYLKTDEAEEDGENGTITTYGLLAYYIADLNLSGLNHESFAYSVIICYVFVIAMSNVIAAPYV